MIMRPIGRSFDESGDGIFLGFHVDQELSMHTHSVKTPQPAQISGQYCDDIWAGCGVLTLCVYRKVPGQHENQEIFRLRIHQTERQFAVFMRPFGRSV